MATNLVAKMGQNYLPPALIALSFLNGMGYSYINVCINSANDTSISCENFMKFGPVSSELTGLICERQIRHGEKNWRIYSNISVYTGPIFAIFSPYESTLYVQMTDL